MVWPIIAGAILAGWSLLVFAQNPVGSGDNGVGTSPMTPLSASDVPRIGNSYGVVPQAPYNPTTSTRPANWVGGTAPAATPINNPPPQNDAPGQYPQTNPYPQTGAAPLSSLQWSDPSLSQGAPANPSANQHWGQPGGISGNSFSKESLNLSENPQRMLGTEILARVGSEAIFVCEVTPAIDRYIAEVKAKMSPEEIEMQRDQFDIQRELMIKRNLKSFIESRLIYQDFLRDVPAENMASVTKTINNEFEKSELPKLLKRENVTTIKELEQKLKAYGTSLAQEKTSFKEKLLVSEAVRRQIKKDEMPTLFQMTQYYEAHKADFTTAPKVRWEELTVSKAKYDSKQEARAAIAQLGNRVMGGEPFAEVAKQDSDGFTAAKGGYRDWISKGSLTDKEIEDAVFNLPVGQLSQIIETTTDYNIIRVIERVDQKTEEFLSAQGQIRKKIMDERTDRLLKEYIAKLDKRTPVWTIYDGDGNNRPLSERLKEEKDPSRYGMLSQGRQ